MSQHHKLQHLFLWGTLCAGGVKYAEESCLRVPTLCTHTPKLVLKGDGEPPRGTPALLGLGQQTHDAMGLAASLALDTHLRESVATALLRVHASPSNAQGLLILRSGTSRAAPLCQPRPACCRTQREFGHAQTH